MESAGLYFYPFILFYFPSQSLSLSLCLFLASCTIYLILQFFYSHEMPFFIQINPLHKMAETGSLQRATMSCSAKNRAVFTTIAKTWAEMSHPTPTIPLCYHRIFLP
jgi:hypothetical protein